MLFFKRDWGVVSLFSWRDWVDILMQIVLLNLLTECHYFSRVLSETIHYALIIWHQHYPVPFTGKLWNSLPLFALFFSYDLNTFKEGVSKRISMSFWWFFLTFILLHYLHLLLFQGGPIFGFLTSLWFCPRVASKYITINYIFLYFHCSFFSLLFSFFIAYVLSTFFSFHLNQSINFFTYKTFLLSVS